MPGVIKDPYADISLEVQRPMRIGVTRTHEQGFRYIPHTKIVDELNECFGPLGWSLIRKELVFLDAWQTGRQTWMACYQSYCELRIHPGPAYKTICVKAGDGVTGPHLPQNTKSKALAMAIKGATVDALKRAAHWLGDRMGLALIGDEKTAWEDGRFIDAPPGDGKFYGRREIMPASKPGGNGGVAPAPSMPPGSALGSAIPNPALGGPPAAPPTSAPPAEIPATQQTIGERYDPAVSSPAQAPARPASAPSGPAPQAARPAERVWSGGLRSQSMVIPDGHVMPPERPQQGDWQSLRFYAGHLAKYLGFGSGTEMSQWSGFGDIDKLNIADLRTSIERAEEHIHGHFQEMKEGANA